jgi:5-methylcytosine-specific restriction protein A
MAAPDFVPGRTYNRRRDIHERYGGQRQGGISTPAKHPVIFAFTGASGTRHGYADEWTADGTLRYFGEGQEGDMTLDKGNRAIAEHAVSGKDILLFETLGHGNVRFRGAFNCAGYDYVEGTDTAGTTRKAIVFNLVPITDGADTIAGSDVGAAPSKQDLIDLRKHAMAAAGPARQLAGTDATKSYFSRSRDVRQYVLARANGVCESCDAPAPFETIAGVYYLEPHHIRRLTDQGPDDPRHMGAICPNCHREIHYGKNGDERNRKLQECITRKEAAIGNSVPERVAPSLLTTQQQWLD